MSAQRRSTSRLVASARSRSPAASARTQVTMSAQMTRWCSPAASHTGRACREERGRAFMVARGLQGEGERRSGPRRRPARRPVRGSRPGPRSPAGIAASMSSCCPGDVAERGRAPAPAPADRSRARRRAARPRSSAGPRGAGRCSPRTSAATSRSAGRRVPPRHVIAPWQAARMSGSSRSSRRRHMLYSLVMKPARGGRGEVDEERAVGPLRLAEPGRAQLLAPVTRGVTRAGGSAVRRRPTRRRRRATCRRGRRAGPACRPGSSTASAAARVNPPSKTASRVNNARSCSSSSA